MSRRSATIAPSPARPPGAGALPWAGMLAAVVVLAVLAYLPALRGQLLWDDAGHVTRPDLRSWTGLWRIWFEPGSTQQYYPLLHTAFWIEHRLWGDAVLGYHLVNVVQHGLAAALLGLFLRRIASPGAWLAALLFALHPVMVESVAWISEQKNTLSAVFMLLSAVLYVRFDDDRRAADYGAATGLFLLALLTKSVTAMLAPGLIVVLWWRRAGRLTARDVAPLVPWVILGAAAGLFTAWVGRTSIGASGEAFDLTLAQRLILAGRVVWFYALKLVWPADLAFMYPRWALDPATAWQWLPSAALLAGVLFVAWKRWRGSLAALLVFLGLLFPVLGFVNVYPFVFSFVADHFQYTAAMAAFAWAAAAWSLLSSRLPPGFRVALPVLLLALLFALTWRQSRIYANETVLYEDTLAKNPGSWMAHNNLALVYTRDGRLEEAAAHLREALAIRPDYAAAENNLGDTLTRLGRAREAIPHLERATALQPGYAEAHNNLGNAYMAAGRAAEARTQYEQAIGLRPDYATAHRNLGLLHAMAGRTGEAIPLFEKAVAMDPDNPEARVSWALALALSGRFEEAVPHFERALELAPDSAAARISYGRALGKAGRSREALHQFRTAVEREPGNAEAHFALAAALRERGENTEAVRHFEEARRLGWK